MTANRPLLEVRLKRRWLVFVALAVPGFAALALAASAQVLSKPPIDVLDILSALFFVVGLGGLLVIPGAALLVRQLRGVPDIRLDRQGVVWGNDRAREQSLDWSAIDRVTSKRIGGNVPERAFILGIRPGRSGRRAQSLYGRIMAFSNRLLEGLAPRP